MRGFLFVLGFGLALPTPAVAVVTLDSRNFEEETNGKTVFIKQVHCVQCLVSEPSIESAILH